MVTRALVLEDIAPPPVTDVASLEVFPTNKLWFIVTLLLPCIMIAPPVVAVLFVKVLAVTVVFAEFMVWVVPVVPVLWAKVLLVIFRAGEYRSLMVAVVVP